MKRVGMVIGIRPEKIAEYKKLHASAWPEILDRLVLCGIRNYTIYLREPENLLFSYYEYHGNDYEGDMKIMSDDIFTQKWWSLTNPCQQPMDSRAEGEWWCEMEQLFHFDTTTESTAMAGAP